MNQSREKTLERALGALGDLDGRASESRDDVAVVELAREGLHAALRRLKEKAGFETLTFVTAVDRLGAERRGGEPRFEVSVQLLSLTHADRVRVRVAVPESDAWVPSCTDLWPGAGFMERECHDMFGIEFRGNADLRRLLMPDGYGHHPLRKDFPHQGIEPDRLYREWDRERRRGWNPEGATR